MRSRDRILIFIVIVVASAFFTYCVKLLLGDDVVMRAAALGSLATMLGVVGAIVAALIASAPVRRQVSHTALQSAVALREAYVDRITSFTQLWVQAAEDAKAMRTDFLGLEEGDVSVEPLVADRLEDRVRGLLARLEHDRQRRPDFGAVAEARQQAMTALERLAKCLGIIHYYISGRDEDWTADDVERFKAEAIDAQGCVDALYIKADTAYTAFEQAITEHLGALRTRLRETDAFIASGKL